jgi:hypothetical protein
MIVTASKGCKKERGQQDACWAEFRYYTTHTALHATPNLSQCVAGQREYCRCEKPSAESHCAIAEHCNTLRRIYPLTER